MTKQESARMEKLEAENVRLREVLSKQMEIYREQLYELVEFRAAMDIIRKYVPAGDDLS